MKLFTIGHSNHSMEKLLRLLDDNGIELLVDVRTAPYSRHNPQFNRESLEAALARGWEKFPDRCYLQITGIYSFPDYLHGRRFIDFAPQLGGQAVDH